MECYNMESSFKFIWIMGAIANRPSIKTQFWHNYENLLSTIHNNLDIAKVSQSNILFSCN